MWVLETNLGPVEKQPVLLTAEPSLLSVAPVSLRVCHLLTVSQAGYWDFNTGLWGTLIGAIVLMAFSKCLY